MIQFSSEDKIDVIAFASKVNKAWSSDGKNTANLLKNINEHDVGGATSLYPSVIEALELLKNETNEYNTSIIVMTDGEGNVGTFNELQNSYQKIGREIPIYSITFASADEEQLEKMANLSNGKVFDGRSDLVLAFKTVRGYN